MYILFEIWHIVIYQMLMFNNFDNCTIIFKKVLLFGVQDIQGTLPPPSICHVNYQSKTFFIEEVPSNHQLVYLLELPSILSIWKTNWSCSKQKCRVNEQKLNKFVSGIR